MKENITKFDFEQAFKALDEIEVPVVKGIKPNREDRETLRESVKRVDRTSMLIEDYYDLSDKDSIEEVKDERDEEIAKAKLARIEKIVDLDADSPEDLLPSYVGKTIIQCPQCMTLFYKNEEDLVKDENDPEVVNVNEPCQHCGNVSGYSVIGKVAEAEKDELDNFEAEEEFPVEEEENELDLDFDEEPVEEVEEEKISEEPEEEKLDLKDEEEKKEESFVKPQGESLVEQVEDALTESVDEDLNKKLDAHNKYIAHVQEKIAAAEKELAEEKNEEIKKLIEKTINAYKEELEAALPEAVKEEEQVEELPDADEVPEEAIEGEEVEEEKVEESLKESICPECGRELKPGEEPCEDCKKELEEEKCCEDQCAIHKAITHPEDDMKELKEEAEDEVEEAEEETAEEKEEEVEEVSEEEIEEVKEELPVEEVVGKIEEVAEEIKEVVEADKEVEEAIDEVVEEKVEEILPEEKEEVEEEEEEIEESLTEDTLSDSDAAVEKMLDSKEFETPISEAEVENYFREAEEVEESLQFEELNEKTINEHISDYLKEVYSNVNNFEATGCSISGKKLVVEGVINFNSGKAKNTCFEFLMTSKDDKHIFFEGCNKDLSEEGKFKLSGCYEDDGKSLVTESIEYSYTINGTLVEGLK